MEDKIIKESESCVNCKYGVNEKHEYYSKYGKQKGSVYCEKKNCSVGIFLICDMWEKK